MVGNTYDLNNQDLQYFITNTQLDREIQRRNLLFSVVNDLKYNINYGDNKSKRHYFIEDLNPEELVDQFKLIVFLKVRGNDNLMFTRKS